MVSCRKVAVAFLTLIVALGAFVFAPAPQASAQDAPQFDVHVALAPGSTCPAGTQNVGKHALRGDIL